MYQRFDIEQWSRKATYNYFKNFENPFFNICFNLNIGALYKCCKTAGISINHALHYCSLMAANDTLEFRLRIKDNEVVCCPYLDGGGVVLLADNSIRFCLYPYDTDYAVFQKAAVEREEEVKRTGVSNLDATQPHVIYYSVIPWLSFTSISQPRTRNENDSIPKITFGKYFEAAATWQIPVSVEVHHALMDGYQIHQFVLAFEQQLAAFVAAHTK